MCPQAIVSGVLQGALSCSPSLRQKTLSCFHDVCVRICMIIKRFFLMILYYYNRGWSAILGFFINFGIKTQDRPVRLDNYDSNSCYLNACVQCIADKKLAKALESINQKAKARGLSLSSSIDSILAINAEYNICQSEGKLFNPVRFLEIHHPWFFEGQNFAFGAPVEKAVSRMFSDEDFENLYQMEHPCLFAGVVTGTQLIYRYIFCTVISREKDVTGVTIPTLFQRSLGVGVGSMNCFFTRLPSMIWIHIDRVHDAQEGDNIVLNPLSRETTFTLSQSLVQHNDGSTESVSYQIRGMICYKGPKTLGHWICYKYKKKRWFCCNDDSVMWVSKDNKQFQEDWERRSVMLFARQINAVV